MSTGLNIESLKKRTIPQQLTQYSFLKFGKTTFRLNVLYQFTTRRQHQGNSQLSYSRNAYIMVQWPESGLLD